MKKFIFALLASATICSAQTYQESGGLVIMETENTPSALGLWQKKTSISGHSGSGYLDFTGNNYESGPATSPLEYTFKITQAGLYYLHLHCARETVVIGAETRVERGECPANWIEDAPAWGALLAIFLTIASTAASNGTDIDKLMAASK